jgi:Na+-driven multidrug efflux pump
MISYLIKQKENNYEQRMLKRRMKDIGIFLKRCIGPAVANIGRTGILIMTSSLCSCCGTVSVAAHQVILSWFYLFCPIGEAVSQTVLNLFPSYLSTKGQKFTKETWSFISTMCKIAFVFGIIDASSVMVPMYIPNIFTTSNEVSLVMRSLSPYLALALFGHVLASFFEGLLIATGDTKYLATMYSLNIIIIGYFYNKLSLINVNVLWMIYVSSIGTRVIEFSFRFLWMHGKR